jgi:PPOX class probable F420-dependent enzyme
MSRRDQIRMSDEEVDVFLHGRHTMNVATLGADGRPHLVAMWYGFLDGAPAFWTFGKSQKIVNLQRDPRITCLVEDGDTYNELRGVELVGTGALVTDQEQILRLAEDVSERYTGPVTDQARGFLRKQALKRVGVRIEVERVVSWDHRKLGGAY